jgi:hypothetical protein
MGQREGWPESEAMNEERKEIPIKKVEANKF